VAPEILQKKPYGMKADIWSVGVITYILLCGYPPFHHENHNVLFSMIKSGEYHFDDQYWKGISSSAKNLISKMLVVNPNDRHSAKQLLEHAWITTQASDQPEGFSTMKLTVAQTNLAQFNARRRFQIAVKKVQAVHRFAKALGASATTTTKISATAPSSTVTTTTTTKTKEKTSIEAADHPFEITVERSPGSSTHSCGTSSACSSYSDVSGKPAAVATATVAATVGSCRGKEKRFTVNNHTADTIGRGIEIASTVARAIGEIIDEIEMNSETAHMRPVPSERSVSGTCGSKANSMLLRPPGAVKLLCP